MKTRNECREWRELLGAYALGHLEGDERAGLEAHLEGCPGCREELAALAPVAQMLPHADPARFELAPQPPPELGRRIAATIEGEKQRTRAAPAAAPLRRPRLRRGGRGRGGGGPAPLRLRRQRARTPASRSSSPTFPRASTSPRRWSPMPTAPRSTCTCTGSSGTLCRVWLKGPRGSHLSRRDLSLPLGRRLRRGAQLRARHLADAGGRRRHRQTHLRRAGGRAPGPSPEPRRNRREPEDLRRRPDRGAGSAHRRLRKRSSSGGAYGGGDLQRLYDSGGRDGGKSGASTNTAAGTGGGGVVAVAKVADLGPVIVNSEGFTLYDFHKDKGGKSSCYGACASAWPPLLTEGEPKAQAGAMSNQLGTTKRKTAPSRSPTPAGRLHLRRRQRPRRSQRQRLLPVRRPVVRADAERRSRV